MKSISLFDLGIYSTAWIRDFYTQAGEWWGADPHASGVHEARVETLERLCGPRSKTVLDLGAGPGATAATLADAGHDVIAVELSPVRANFAHGLAEIPRKGSLTILYHFDPLHSRWIDEWMPVAEPAKALAQTIRCYTPPDLLLLLEGTHLAMKHIEVDGQELDVKANAIATSSPLMNAWCYLVQLILDGNPAP